MSCTFAASGRARRARVDRASPVRAGNGRDPRVTDSGSARPEAARDWKSPLRPCKKRGAGRYIGAPAVIQLSIVLICAVVKQARGFELFVEHSSGMRAFEQPVTLALMIWLRTLVAVSLGTTSFIVLQVAIVFEALGDMFTRRMYRPELLRRSTWALPSWQVPPTQLPFRSVATAAKPPPEAPPPPLLPPLEPP